MTQKEKAIECLQELDIFCTDLFVAKNKIAVFDSFLGEALSTYPGLAEKINEIEQEYGCLVYAVTHEFLPFGECLSMLIVSKYEEDWEQCLQRIDTDKFLVYAYVWNTTDDACSEFGYITVLTGFGGIVRVG